MELVTDNYLVFGCDGRRMKRKGIKNLKLYNFRGVVSIVHYTVEKGESDV